MLIVWTALGFLSGSFMFSYWLGRIARHNLRHVADGNPGAFNLWRAAGYKLGIAGVALDFLKGYAPVFLFVQSYGSENAAGLGLVPIALAPVAGHAFSPFLKFRGGKAIAATFGVWSALTRFEASLAYAVILAVLLLVGRAANKGRPVSHDADGLQVVLGMLLLSVYLYARAFPPAVIWVSFGNLALLAYTHRRELMFYMKRRQSDARKRDDHFSV